GIFAAFHCLAASNPPYPSLLSVDHDSARPSSAPGASWHDHVLTGIDVLIYLDLVLIEGTKPRIGELRELLLPAKHARIRFVLAGPVLDFGGDKGKHDVDIV